MVKFVVRFFDRTGAARRRRLVEDTQMAMTRWMIVMFSAALCGGCTLNADPKNACVVQDDCLSGFVCQSGTCVADDSNTNDNGGVDGNDDEPAPDAYGFGKIESIEPHSAGSTDGSWSTRLAVTSAPGSLGCALLKSESASPGVAAAVLEARISVDADRDPCPVGVHAIRNDPARCSYTEEHPSLDTGCAGYQRWDAAGVRVTMRKAIGGYVHVAQSPVGNGVYACNVELSLHFAGGISFENKLTFEYEPFALESEYCAPI
jgi:hypothetical protein